jgi:hypothetical protein
MKYADDILEKTGQVKSDFTFSSMGQGTATGAIVGLVGGVLFAYFQKRQFVPCMLVGTIAGGLVSRIFLIKK